MSQEIDDKKMVGDGVSLCCPCAYPVSGSFKAVELNVDKSKYMPCEVWLPRCQGCHPHRSLQTAAKLIIKAQGRKEKKYHLTSGGSAAGTMHALFPGLINSVRSTRSFRFSILMPPRL
jgi:hypothetical protein